MDVLILTLKVGVQATSLLFDRGKWILLVEARGHGANWLSAMSPAVGTRVSSREWYGWLTDAC